MSDKKFKITCQKCHTKISYFSEWFAYGQKCPECGSNQVCVEYEQGYDQLTKLIKAKEPVNDIWYYADYLPVQDKRNILSFSEGIVPIERWSFLENFAWEKHHIECKILVQRYDLSPATGTFKDLAGTVTSSVLSENGQKSYVVASTGNIANSYARYLSAANISVYAFLPHLSSVYMEAGVAAFGQKVIRVDGDYDNAKTMAATFARENNILLAAGNFDPMRIEAKKTMVYEWLRLLQDFPTVYIQAVSGGTGPLGIKKAFQELEGNNLVEKIPRQILVQSDKCAPMAIAWEKAKNSSFKPGWETDYPIIENPETNIPTLSTGNPKTYPVLGKFVKDSGGEIISCEEDKAIDVARLVALEASVLSGPAASLPVAGLIKALSQGIIKNNDVIILNLGEGIGRSPQFMEQLISPVKAIKYLQDCSTFDRNRYREQIWNIIYNMF